MRCVSDNYPADLELCDSTVFWLMQKKGEKNIENDSQEESQFRSLFSDAEFWIIVGLFEEMLSLNLVSLQKFWGQVSVSYLSLFPLVHPWVLISPPSAPQFQQRVVLRSVTFSSRNVLKAEVLLYLLLWTEAATAGFASSVFLVSDFHALGPPPPSSHRLEKTKRGTSCLRNITVSQVHGGCETCLLNQS